MHLRGLRDRVEVLRDRWGVPHIYAQNIRDALYAQGFVHAQDRFWQMDFIRRLIAGRVSEVAGKQTVEVDRWMRILGLRRVAEREVDLLNEREQGLANAYVDGVNAFLQQGHLPLEFSLMAYQPEPWTVVDTLSWGKLMAWTLSANWESELLRGQLIERLGPEKAAELEVDAEDAWPLVLDALQGDTRAQHLSSQARRLTGPGPSQGVGSNNWVVTGERSASRAPLLANDMHLLMSIPAIWYENHLEGGELRVTGVSLPGVPLVISGHNGRIAWGFTAGFSDVQDLYEEHLREGEGGRLEYEYQGEWHPAEVRQEEIQVRGGKPVIEEVVETRYGPLINGLVAEGFSGPCLALRWTSFTPRRTLEPLYQINTAQNADAFREGAREWACPVLNAVYADREGNIGYHLLGDIPIRSQGDGCVPVPGWTGEYEWVGLIPYDELPQAFNPARGYLATANNRIAGQDYPYHLARDYVYGDRALRIQEWLEELSTVDTETMCRMQFDQISPTGRVIARYIGSLTVEDPDLDPVVKLVQNWDGRLTADSSAAAVHQVFVRQILNLMLTDKLGDLALHYTGKGPNPILASISIWGFHAWEWLAKLMEKPDSPWFDLGQGEQRDDVIRLALYKTVEFLKTELGPEIEDWAWGKLHTLTFNHILGRVGLLAPVFNRGPYPVGGDGTTIWATFSTSYDLSSDLPSGPPFRFIADLSDLDHCLGLLAPGQSGNPASPHYDDQVEAWFNQGYHMMWFSRDDVEANAEERLDLAPY